MRCKGPNICNYGMKIKGFLWFHMYFLLSVLHIKADGDGLKRGQRPDNRAPCTRLGLGRAADGLLVSCIFWFPVALPDDSAVTVRTASRANAITSSAGGQGEGGGGFTRSAPEPLTDTL